MQGTGGAHSWETRETDQSDQEQDPTGAEGFHLAPQDTPVKPTLSSFPNQQQGYLRLRQFRQGTGPEGTEIILQGC